VSKIIKITVSPTGETKIQTRGFIGRACKLASAFLEKALGVVTKDEATTTQAEEHQCSKNVQQRQ
jgi:hypothetical protein